ncbi:MAG: tRNA pseudouridine(38-40) synthase TruA [Clostridiales bacterium 38-18]|nr:MAG: tRNA pseudouridine(38-40) synthase TruA [Clostridiales bacterium 38-18]
MTYKLIIQYEGTRYKGWQRLKTTDQTIQQKIENVLSRLLGEPIEIDGSGRTDAGVHALGQVASFKVTETISNLNEFRFQMNQYLPDDIIVLEIQGENDRFHARLNAVSKTYVYQIWLAEQPPLIERNWVLNLGSKRHQLNFEKMKLASEELIGKKDFKGFSTDKTKKGTIRTIESINWEIHGDVLQIKFTGDGFLYNMVRIIVGTLLEIGFDERQVDSLNQIIVSKDRALAGETAPAHGLYLESVRYE